MTLIKTCKNCKYFKADYGIWCMNGWSGDGSTGFCQIEPGKSTSVSADRLFCGKGEAK